MSKRRTPSPVADGTAPGAAATDAAEAERMELFEFIFKRSRAFRDSLIAELAAVGVEVSGGEVTVKTDPATGRCSLEFHGWTVRT